MAIQIYEQLVFQILCCRILVLKIKTAHDDASASCSEFGQHGFALNQLEGWNQFKQRLIMRHILIIDDRCASCHYRKKLPISKAFIWKMPPDRMIVKQHTGVSKWASWCMRPKIFLPRLGREIARQQNRTAIFRKTDQLVSQYIGTAHSWTGYCFYLRKYPDLPAVFNDFAVEERSSLEQTTIGFDGFRDYKFNQGDWCNLSAWHVVKGLGTLNNNWTSWKLKPPMQLTNGFGLFSKIRKQ